MQIQPNHQQDQNERIFTDYIGRQPVTNHRQFTLDIDDYRKQNPLAAQQIIKDPTKYYRLIKKYLEEQQKQNENVKNKVEAKIQHFQIKIQGNLGANFVTPRGLSSRMANELVGLQGIITKIQLPKKYLEKSVHYCQATKTFQMREYPDSFNPEKDVELNLRKNIKLVDQQNNPLSFEYGFSTFKNIQMAVIQQLPEMAPPGLLPMSVQVVLQNKLVDSIKPGDRVQMIGIYKLISMAATKQRGIFRPFFLCLSVKPLTQIASMNKKPAKLDLPENQIFDILSRSVAPSLWGHEQLKKAVLLMLIGGVEKITPNNTHLRGDINILMVGDPGTAKSQMLRWVLSTVDVSIGTTGSGASGVGLTAAIVTDPQTGQKTLEAGAMVLADRGVVCIDEFDKMNETDRVAVHEVMEQQTVTIAKAGLHCSLNARCAVIAAANPVYGEYQQRMAPTKNVNMPDSLLSRFDLIFIIRDQKKVQRDRQIAQKVCKNHRLAPQVNDFLNQYMDSTEYVVNPISEKKQDDGIYEKNNVYKGQGKNEIVTQTYLKRYINWVKLTFEPILTDQSVRLCAELWALLRQKDMNDRQSNNIKVLPITIRSLESLIRLSTAHAKLRQSETVEIKDVVEGFKLMSFCLRAEEDAFQEELNLILKRLGFDYQVEYKQPRKKQVIFEQRNHDRKNQRQKKQEEESKKMEEEEVKQKMSKLNLEKVDAQVDEVLYKHSQKSQSQQNQVKALVFKTIADLKRKKKYEGVTFTQLYDKIPSIHRNIIDKVVKQLEEDNGKVTVQNNKIYM